MLLVLLCCQPDVIDVDGEGDINHADMVDGDPDIVVGHTNHSVPQRTVSTAKQLICRKKPKHSKTQSTMPTSRDVRDKP